MWLIQSPNFHVVCVWWKRNRSAEAVTYASLNQPHSCKEKTGLTPGVRHEATVKAGTAVLWHVCVVVTCGCGFSSHYVFIYRETLLFSADLCTFIVRWTGWLIDRENVGAAVLFLIEWQRTCDTQTVFLGLLCLSQPLTYRPFPKH